EDRNQALRELEAAMKAMNPYVGEYRFRRKDGSFVWMRDRGFFVPDEDGRARVMLGMMEDITQARELEERVAFSELKHRLLFEHANDGVLLMNGDVITDCNPRGLELFGCTREDLVGQTLYAFSPPHQVDGSESKARLQEHIRKGQEGTPQRFTWRHIRRDGSPFEAAVRLTRFELAGEALLQVQVRDRTAEAEAREELARSEETYRRLVLEASDPILVADGEGKLVEVNQAASELFGYSREDLLKRSVADLSDIPKEEALAWYRQFYARLISEDHGIMADQFMRRKDGTRFPFEMSAALLGNGLLQAFIHDVSKRKQAEEELDRIYTLATTFHGMELLDKAAAALAEMLSMHYVSIGEIRDQSVKSLTFYKHGKLLHDTTHSLQGSPCERALADRAPCFIESGASSAFPDDPLLQEWKIESVIGVPMLDNRRNVMGIVALLDDRPHDFSEHEKKIVSIIAQRLASELDMLGQRKREEQLSQQLAQSQKMESLGTLAGGVAHDFNNILGAVIGYITLIKKRVNNDEQIARYLDAIEKSAQRAASLSKQLLSFSHKTQGEIRPVAVNDLVKDTIHIIASSFQKNIGLHTQLAGELPPVLGDSNLLGQVVMNLCINARDAVSERTDRSGGSITVTTSLFKAGAGFVDLRLSEIPGDYVCVCVKDDGVGMDPGVKARIFEPFYTTKGKGRGTGLGLSMVYGIVRNHNGAID
ncbi:MAG TPA: PAS domain S-box protein, partial [Bacteroidota bacterium]